MPLNDIKFNLAEKRTRNLLFLFSLFPLTLPVRTVVPPRLSQTFELTLHFLSKLCGINLLPFIVGHALLRIMQNSTACYKTSWNIRELCGMFCQKSWMEWMTPFLHIYSSQKVKERTYFISLILVQLISFAIKARKGAQIRGKFCVVIIYCTHWINYSICFEFRSHSSAFLWIRGS